jgi:hypothetical protein
MIVWQAKTYATHILDYPKRAHGPAFIKKALMDLPEAPAAIKGAHGSARDSCSYKRRSWKLPEAQYKS